MKNNKNNETKSKNKFSISINLYFLIPYITLIILRYQEVVKYNWFWVITSFLWVPILCIFILAILCLIITQAIDYAEKIFNKK